MTYFSCEESVKSIAVSKVLVTEFEFYSNGEEDWIRSIDGRCK